jgi:hypothetical protein
MKCEVQRWNAQNNNNAKYLYTSCPFSVHLFTHFNVMRYTNTLQKEIQFTIPDGNRNEFDGENIKHVSCSKIINNVASCKFYTLLVEDIHTLYLSHHFLDYCQVVNKMKTVKLHFIRFFCMSMCQSARDMTVRNLHAQPAVWISAALYK